LKKDNQELKSRLENLEAKGKSQQSEDGEWVSVKSDPREPPLKKGGRRDISKSPFWKGI
jgi:hypothetical protein